MLTLALPWLLLLLPLPLLLKKETATSKARRPPLPAWKR